MVRLQDEPIADPVCVPVYYVSKLARDNGVDRRQVGEGADELFCGYPVLEDAARGSQRCDDLPVPRAAEARRRRARDAAAARDSRRESSPAPRLAGQPVFWGGAEAFTEAQKQRLLSPRLRERARGLTSWEALEPIRARFEEKALGAVAPQLDDATSTSTCACPSCC